MPTFSYNSPEDGNDDFTPGSIIASSQANGNFEVIKDWLNGAFVGTANIIDGSVTNDKLALNAVESDNILDGTIIGNDIADLTITAGKLADNSIQDRHVTALSNPADTTNGIDGQKLHTSSITADKIDPSVLFPGGVPAGSVGNTQLQDNSVSLTKMQDNSVDTPELVDGAVTGSKIDPVLAGGVAIEDTSQLFMIGEVRDLIVPGVPAGWLICDGSAVSQATYSELWDAMGNAHIYGPDPGNGDFLLPDLRDRTTVGAGSAVLTANDQIAFGSRSMTLAHTHLDTFSIANANVTTQSAFDDASRYEEGYILNESGAATLVSQVAGFGLTSTSPSSDGLGGSPGVKFTKLNHYHETPAHTHTLNGAVSTTNDTTVRVPHMVVNKIIFVNA